MSYYQNATEFYEDQEWDFPSQPKQMLQNNPYGKSRFVQNTPYSTMDQPPEGIIQNGPRTMDQETYSPINEYPRRQTKREPFTRAQTVRVPPRIPHMYNNNTSRPYTPCSANKESLVNSPNQNYYYTTQQNKKSYYDNCSGNTYNINFPNNTPENSLENEHLQHEYLEDSFKKTQQLLMQQFYSENSSQKNRNNQDQFMNETGKLRRNCLQNSKSFDSLKCHKMKSIIPSDSEIRYNSKTQIPVEKSSLTSQGGISQENLKPQRKSKTYVCGMTNQEQELQNQIEQTESKTFTNADRPCSGYEPSYTPPLTKKKAFPASPAHQKVAIRVSSCAQDPVVGVPIIGNEKNNNNPSLVYVPASILNVPNTMVVTIQQESYPGKKLRVTSELEKRIEALELEEVKLVNDNLQELQEARRRLIYDVMCAKTHGCNSLQWCNNNNSKKSYETYLLTEQLNKANQQEEIPAKQPSENNLLNSESISSNSFGCDSKSDPEYSQIKEDNNDPRMMNGHCIQECIHNRQPSSIANLLFLRDLPTSELDRLIRL